MEHHICSGVSTFLALTLQKPMCFQQFRSAAARGPSMAFQNLSKAFSFSTFSLPTSSKGPLRGTRSCSSPAPSGADAPRVSNKANKASPEPLARLSGILFDGWVITATEGRLLTGEGLEGGTHPILG